jgi:hypothetical protein
MLYSVIEIEEDDLQEEEEPYTTYCVIRGEYPDSLFVGEFIKASDIVKQLVENNLNPEFISDYIKEYYE